jgi:hypothetical protein
VTKKCDPLKEDEARRLKEQLDAGLAAGGYQFNGFKLPAKLQLLNKQNTTEKEVMTNGESEGDILRYFKLMSPDVYETIFEE